MRKTSIISTGCLSFIMIFASPAESFPPAPPDPPPEPIASALSASMVEPDTVLEEVRRFCETRIVRPPEASSPEQRENLVRQLRGDLLEKIVLRGEARRWHEAELKVEWLETMPATRPADHRDGYSIRKLRFEAVPGLWIPALLYVPDNLEGIVPIGLSLHGHNRALGKAADYKQIRCINQAKRGMMVLSPEWPHTGQLKTDGFSHYRASQLDLCGTSAVAPFYLSLKRSVDLLLSLPNADASRVAVSGLSGGGWQTIFISSLDPRVALANPVAGFSSFLTRARYPSDLGDTEQSPCDMATVADYTHLIAMRAPRPTLLTYNSKDDCCFASGHALQPLLEAARPFYALCDAENNLRWHINDVPGTHNFEQENREAFYKMLGEHFFAGTRFDWREIPCRDEVKTSEQLDVPLPEDNEDFNTLARKLMANLPKAIPNPTAAKDKSAPARDKLREIVHFKDYETNVETVPQESTDDIKIRQMKFKLGNDWSVPATEFAAGSPVGTTLIIADQGRKTLSDPVWRLVRENQRVIAIDPFYFGSSTIIARDSLHALLVACCGERPLGIQAGQIASIARWARATYAEPVTLMAVGPRTSTIALVAAALEQDAIGRLDLHEPLTSLKLIIERNIDVEKMPELFCFGLLEYFDIKDIAALVMPRGIREIHK